MKLDTLLRYLVFYNVVLEIHHDETLNRYSDFDMIPDNLMLRHVKSFSPKMYGGNYCLEVELYDE